MIKCPNCGAELNDNAKFCDNCGSKIEKKKSSNKKIVLAVIITAVICIAIAGGLIWFLNGKDKPKEVEKEVPKAELENEIELSAESIAGSWEKSKDDIVCRLTFGEDNEVIYEEFESESDKPYAVSEDGEYEIEDDNIKLSMTLNDKEVAETLNTAVSENELMFVCDEEEKSLFAGTYSKVEVKEEEPEEPTDSSVEVYSVTLESLQGTTYMKEAEKQYIGFVGNVLQSKINEISMESVFEISSEGDMIVYGTNLDGSLQEMATYKTRFEEKANEFFLILEGDGTLAGEWKYFVM